MIEQDERNAAKQPNPGGGGSGMADIFLRLGDIQQDLGMVQGGMVAQGTLLNTMAQVFQQILTSQQQTLLLVQTLIDKLPTPSPGVEA